MNKKIATALLLAAFAAFGIIFLSGCSTPSRKVPKFIPPESVGISSIQAPSKAATESAKKAKKSASNALQIAQKMGNVPSKSDVSKLKLELSTTVEELRVTTEKLEQVSSQIPVLEKKAKALEDSANTAITEARQQADRADNAVKQMKRAAAERDLFVNLFAISLTIGVLMAFAPLVRNVAASAGAYAPVAAIAIWVVGAVAVYLAAFWIIRLCLRVFISML